MSITKDELLCRVNHSLLFDQPIECSFDMLRFAFGFKRVSGVDFMLAKLLKPSVTEEQMSYLPNHEICSNILSWSKENGFACYINEMAGSVTWYKLVKKEPK